MLLVIDIIIPYNNHKFMTEKERKKAITAIRAKRRERPDELNRLFRSEKQTICFSFNYFLVRSI